jgi:N-acetyl-anhydromuramyl-L-alanine amidase AmpD
MIIVHWTCIPSVELTFKIFNAPTLAVNRRDKLPGNLNVSSHFLVDRDGTIYQLMPETWMARHAIGLNHYAIGIENVGGIDGKDDLTIKQAQANAFLVCYLKNKYQTITYAIGHNDYLSFKNTSLWLEKDPKYQTDKEDPGPSFLKRVKKLIGNQTMKSIKWGKNSSAR